MDTSPDDPAATDEQALMDCLFAPGARGDPAAAALSHAVIGCQHGFVTAALHDRRLVASPIPASDDLMFQVAARFLSRLPPDRHRATRGAFTGLFSPRRVEQYRDLVAEVAARLLHGFPPQGPVDLVGRFAHPLPFTVICRVLGVPPDRYGWLGEQMEVFGRGVARQRDRAAVDAGNVATASMLAFFDDLLDRRQKRPAEDLLTVLATGRRHGATRDELLANCIFFVLAGHATTTALITGGTQLLSAHPEQVRWLQRQPSRWPAAVEELLRLISPQTLTGVTAVQDAEVAGVPVPAGARRALVFAAANRDAAVFTDPLSLDLARSPNPHLAFSAGSRYCLGAPLARLHGEVALSALFDRLPGLHVVDEPEWLGAVPIRQVASMAVDWRPR